MISVRQASDLPPASFRFPVTQDTLALGYILPAVGRIGDFHPLKHAPAGRTKKTADPSATRNGSSFNSCLFELEFNYVNSAKLLAVLRILLCVESNLLALFKSLEAVAYDCGKVYEYVVAAIIVGDESVAFLRIEPLNCTVVHFGTSIKN